MTPLRAGLLHTRVTVTRPDGVRDDLGGAGGGTVALAPLWAALAPVSAGRWTATVRRPAGIAAGDVLHWGGKRLEVRRVVDDPGAPDRLVLELEERG